MVRVMCGPVCKHLHTVVGWGSAVCARRSSALYSNSLLHTRTRTRTHSKHGSPCSSGLSPFRWPETDVRFPHTRTHLICERRSGILPSDFLQTSRAKTSSCTVIPSHVRTAVTPDRWLAPPDSWSQILQPKLLRTLFKQQLKYSAHLRRALRTDRQPIGRALRDVTECWL